MGNRHVKRGERKLPNWDVNSLYVWSMSHFLRTGVFQEIEVTMRKEKKIGNSSLQKWWIN